MNRKTTNKLKKNEKMMAKKCIVLSRISTENQSIISQTAEAKKMALADGYADEDIIVIENVESGSKNDLEHLKGIQSMEGYIKQNDVACVYCTELSRLSRKPEDLHKLKSFFIKNKIQLKVMSPNFTLLNKDGSVDEKGLMVFSMFVSVVEQDNYFRVERCLRGREQRRKEGKFIGGKCLTGYSYDANKNFIVNDEEAKIIKRIYCEYLNGKSKLAIGRELREEGNLKTYSSDVDAHTFIDNVLRNSDYTGQNYKPKIIEVEMFEAVQLKLKEKQCVKSSTKRPCLCNGLLFNPDSANKINKYYVNTRIGSYFCFMDSEKAKRVYINIYGLDALVWKVVKEVYISSSYQEDALNDRLELMKRAKDRIETLKKSIKKSNEKIDKITDLYVDGNIDKQKFLDRKQALEEQIETDRMSLAEKFNEAKILSEVSNEFDLDYLDGLTFEERKEFVFKVIERIDLVRPKKFHWIVTIRFKCRTNTLTFEVYSYSWKYWYVKGDLREEVNVGFKRGSGLTEEDKAFNAKRYKKYGKNKENAKLSNCGSEQ